MFIFSYTKSVNLNHDTSSEITPLYNSLEQVCRDKMSSFLCVKLHSPLPLDGEARSRRPGSGAASACYPARRGSGGGRGGAPYSGYHSRPPLHPRNVPLFNRYYNVDSSQSDMAAKDIGMTMSVPYI